jgi:hypothetical protein
MKSKLKKIMGVGLAIALLSSLMVAVIPASAGTLVISDQDDVTALRDGEDYILAPPGISIVDLAVNGDVILAATGDTTYPLFRSKDGGVTWTDMSTTTDFPSGSAINKVAIAPDDADIVTIATTAGATYYSNNGGDKWNDMDTPTTDIYDIDVSVDVDGIHFLAAGGTTGTPGTPELYVLELDVGKSWAARSSGGTSANFTPNQDQINAVKFSPNFDIDRIIVCVSGDNSTGEAWLQVFREEEDAYTWNGNITFFDETDWDTGVELTDDLETITGGIASASIAMIETYDGTDEGERIVFAGVAGATDGGGLVRVVDSFAKEFETWASGTEGPIHSVAYHESGKLLAGDYEDNQVYRCLTPMATDPRFERVNDEKQPGGEEMTLVAWSGDNAVAGTSGDESAFAKSTNDAYSFDDIGLIDTGFDGMFDMAVSADGSLIYLTTYNGTDASVWLKASAWKRVLSLPDQTTGQSALLIRLAPEDGAVVYVSANNSQDMWVSKNSGTETWKHVPCYKLSAIRDFVCENADVVYAIYNQACSKTLNSGSSWKDEESLDVTTAHNISLAPNGHVLVGTTNGYVSYSENSGESFDVTTPAVGDGGTCYPIADMDYDTNDTIYIAEGDGVYRGKTKDTIQSWANRGPDLGSNEAWTGVVRGSTGIMYFLTSDGSDSYLWRPLNLTSSVDTSELALWSDRKSANETFDSPPQALKLSDGPQLWFIDTKTNTVFSYKDPIATEAPTLKAPTDGAEIPVNPETARAYNVTFTWERYASKYVTEMEIEVSTESDFTGIIYEEVFGDGTPTSDTDIDTDTITKVVGPLGASNQQAEFMPGQTYYWRVRVAENGPQYSPWSAARSFRVAQAVSFGLTSPAMGATDVGIMPTLTWNEFEGAIGYEVMVGEDPTFAIIDFSHSSEQTFYQITEPLAYGTTYYWRVRGVTGPAPAKKAAPGGPWMTGVFTTMAKPEKPEPTVITVPEPAPPAPPAQIIQVPVPQPQPIPSYLLWTIIGVGAILVIALIILIVRTRRVV